MNFHIITIFPKIFNSYFDESILKRAQKDGIIKINKNNLRNWCADKHKKVDDSPYGGGAGMVMKVEPLYKCISNLKSQISNLNNNSPFVKGGGGDFWKKTRIILLSARGKKWNQQKAKKFSQTYNDIILICGRYEGVDERIKKFIDEEISIGDYVLTGGEIPAMIMVDSITRLLPGALGNDESALNESHSKIGILEHPQYTRPEIFVADGKKLKVPKILTSGNHQKIKEWREKNNKKLK